MQKLKGFSLVLFVCTFIFFAGKNNSVCAQELTAQNIQALYTNALLTGPSMQDLEISSDYMSKNKYAKISLIEKLESNTGNGELTIFCNSVQIFHNSYNHGYMGTKPAKAKIMEGSSMDKNVYLLYVRNNSVFPDGKLIPEYKLYIYSNGMFCDVSEYLKGYIFQPQEINGKFIIPNTDSWSRNSSEPVYFTIFDPGKVTRSDRFTNAFSHDFSISYEEWQK